MGFMFYVLLQETDIYSALTFLMMIIGACMNILVMGYNGWKMPVKLKKGNHIPEEKLTHFSYNQDRRIRFSIFADRFKVRIPWKKIEYHKGKPKIFYFFYSIGDVIILIGFVLNFLVVPLFNL